MDVTWSTIDTFIVEYGVASINIDCTTQKYLQGPHGLSHTS